MADFTSGDIEEAKKRVFEMQKRASSFLGSSADRGHSGAAEQKRSDGGSAPGRGTDGVKKEEEAPAQNKKSEGEKKEDISLIFLIMLILLSQDESDEKLLLALLFLLF